MTLTIYKQLFSKDNMEIKVEIPDEDVAIFNKCISEEALFHLPDWSIQQFLKRAFNIALYTYQSELSDIRKSENKVLEINKKV